MLERIRNLDSHFSELITGLHLHPKLRAALKVFVRIGDGWIWIPVIGCMFLKKSRAEFFDIGRHCLTALGISLAFYWPIKRSVCRIRPFQRMPDLTMDVSPLDRFSFPSGHTMNNLAIGLVVAHYFPSVLWLMVLLPILWGLVRVYFGLHFLSDIVAGCVLGICSFELAMRALPK